MCLSFYSHSICSPVFVVVQVFGLFLLVLFSICSLGSVVPVLFLWPVRLFPLFHVFFGRCLLVVFLWTFLSFGLLSCFFKDHCLFRAKFWYDLVWRWWTYKLLNPTKPAPAPASKPHRWIHDISFNIEQHPRFGFSQSVKIGHPQRQITWFGTYVIFWTTQAPPKQLHDLTKKRWTIL